MKFSDLKSILSHEPPCVVLMILFWSASSSLSRRLEPLLKYHNHTNNASPRKEYMMNELSKLVKGFKMNFLWINFLGIKKRFIDL